MATTNPANLPGEAVDPGAAQGAQIPLQSFVLPDFPPEAKGLKALTLTCDIKVDEYQETLSKPYSIPDSIPFAIESLTLELFSLGYPPGFLNRLAERLPNLKSVVIYSQLLGGISKESAEDAALFFKKLPNLRALHLLDVFAKPGFFAQIAPWLKYSASEEPGEARRGLMFLEVNYTFRHEDEDFMAQIPATELGTMVGPGLISCSFNVAAPEDASEDDQDPSNVQGAANKEGIMAFNKTLSAEIVKAFTEGDDRPKGLRALNSTLFTFTLPQFQTVLATQKNVMVLNMTLEVEPGEACKKELLKGLEGCPQLEQVEIVANPSLQFFMEVQNPKSNVVGKTFPSAADMDALTKKCDKLSALRANVLRTTSFGTVAWERKDGKWTGGVKEGTAAVEQADGERIAAEARPNPV